MTPFHILSLIFVTAYIPGLLTLIGLPDPIVKVLTEAPVLLLMLWLIMRGAPLAPGWGWVLLFSLACLASGFSNGDGLVSALLWGRSLIYNYIILWAAYSLRLPDIRFKQILRLIILLWLLQIVASLFKMFVMGSRLEQVVGTIDSSGGSAAAAFPLLVSSFALCQYLLRDRATPWLALSLLSALVGYASGKRAIYFHLPLLYTAVLAWCGWRLRDRTTFARLASVVAIAILIIPVFFFGIQHSKQIAYEHTNADLSEQFQHAVETAVDYETKSQQGRSTGRISSTQNLIRWLSQADLATAALGNGPSCLVGGKKGKTLLKIDYAVSGFVADAASVGLAGAAALVAFYLTLWVRVVRHRPRGASAYLDAVYWGTLVLFPVFLALYSSYCTARILGGWFSYVHMWLAGWLLSRAGAPPLPDGLHPRRGPAPRWRISSP